MDQDQLRLVQPHAEPVEETPGFRRGEGQVRVPELDELLSFGREGLSRRIAFYKCVALVEGTNIARRELGLPEAGVRVADPKLWFAGREGAKS